MPLMSSAKSTIESLQEEEISDQKDEIKLQKKLISKKAEELGEWNEVLLFSPAGELCD